MRSLKDAQGQLLATVSYLYDAQGRLTEVEDPQGYATELDYNGLGQLQAVTQPGNRVTRLHYNENSDAVGLTDPRQNTTEQLKERIIGDTHKNVRYRGQPGRRGQT